MLIRKNARYPTLVLCLILCLVFLTPAVAYGEGDTGKTYYVDPVNGNDSNSGLSQDNAWKTVPGTMKADGSAYLNAAWGDITTGNKIQAGTRIEIKAGSRFDSSFAGQLMIEDAYYENGTPDAPVTIAVSETWGKGNLIYDGTGITGNWGLVGVRSRSYIHIIGAGPNRLFVVQNYTCSTGVGLAVNSRGGDWRNPALPHHRGFYAEYIEAKNNLWGMDVSFHDDFTVKSSVAHDNLSFGITAGNQDDRTTHNGNFIKCTAYNNGIADPGADGKHGYVQWGAINLTYKDCVAYNNGRDGFDSGTANNDAPSSVTYFGCKSYDNGEDGFGTNGSAWMYYDNVDYNKAVYENCTAYNNGQCGWDCYGGVTAYINHCEAYDNGKYPGWAGNLLIYSNCESITRVTLRHNMFYKPRNHANVYIYTEEVLDENGNVRLPTFVDSDYNTYIPRASDDEIFFEQWGNAFDYKNIPTDIEGISFGTNDKIGIQYDNSRYLN